MSHRIVYERWTFPASKIDSGNLYLAASLYSSSLEVNSFVVTVRCDDPSIRQFRRNAKLLFYVRPDVPMIFRVQGIERVGPNLYEISSTSTLGLLTEGQHMGGIYTGQTVEEVVPDICGSVPVIVKTSLREIKLYGWLPRAEPRSNLAQVLLAIGATLKTDLDGVLRVEGLWDSVSSTVGKDRIYTGPSVPNDSKITGVIVTEHQYMPGTEEKQLFDGTADEGYVITFDEPMHSLSASGFSILASGANWAMVSAGAGTLTGKTYIHNTRQVSQAIYDAEVPNIKTEADATLVSLANSAAVAKRLAAYYRCDERVVADVIYRGEIPGDVVDVWHPFDRTVVSACLESADITISNTLKAKEKLLVDYDPPQIGEVSNLDCRQVLTGAGQWIPPEGTEEVRYVMFSGAQGGQAGQKGGNSETSKSHSYTVSFVGTITSRGQFRLPGAGGKGGLGGLGGKGSKLLQGTMSVTPGVPIAYNCGVGGLGSADSDTPGAEGAPTTFGGLTTDSGAYPSDAGWQDPFTQEIFASSGEQGLPGGDGAGADPDYTIPAGSYDMDEVLRYRPATGAYDEDGKYWPGAPTMEKSSGISWYKIPFSANPAETGFGEAGFQMGPGGVAGVTQPMPTARGTWTLRNDRIAVQAASGLTPPAVPAAPRKRGPTLGGRGGYGGGGASASSWAGAESKASGGPTMEVTPGAPGVGGLGGPGSQGGDGMIILFYSVRQGEAGTALFMDKKGRPFRDKFIRRFIV